MNKIIALALSSIFAFAPALAEPLRLAHSTWVGYGPFYIARDKGFFTDEGLEVELIVMEDTAVRVAAMTAGRIDVVATTIDTVMPFMTEEKQFRYIFAVDDSKGGDGVVADEDIKSLADLRGKKVAFGEGTASHFYLAVLLQEVGLSFDDLEVINMTAADAGAAFVAKRVNAAVTWEPWLTRGRQASHGHLLIDSSKHPGLITDIAVTMAETADSRREDLKALTRAWNRAVAFVETNPDEADAIMAKGVGGWLEDPKVFRETRGGIKFYGAEGNKEFFGTADNPGPLRDTVQYALDFWKSIGRMKSEPEAASTIVHEFVRQ